MNGEIAASRIDLAAPVAAHFHHPRKQIHKRLTLELDAQTIYLRSTGFGDGMLAGHYTLRSKTPEMTEQEWWGTLLG